MINRLCVLFCFGATMASFLVNGSAPMRDSEAYIKIELAKEKQIDSDWEEFRQNRRDWGNLHRPSGGNV